MAKKKASDMATPAPRRSTTTRRTKSVSPELTPTPSIATADDSARTAPPSAPAGPNYDDIARAAYLRYLNRGGGHGGDLADWIEAERELKQR